jgi:hypothetical protein
MLAALQIVALLLLALVLTTTLAHALELPGKLRLSKDDYLTIQPIYYPGFTIAGGAEPVGMLALAVLSFLSTGVGFWLTIGALLALAIGHGIYWIVTHPVNNFWLKGAELKGAGEGFFGFAARSLDTSDWTALRDRWEYSHVARAAFAMAAFLSLATAIAVDRA